MKIMIVILVVIAVVFAIFSTIYIKRELELEKNANAIALFLLLLWCSPLLIIGVVCYICSVVIRAIYYTIKN